MDHHRNSRVLDSGLPQDLPRILAINLTRHPWTSTLKQLWMIPPWWVFRPRLRTPKDGPQWTPSELHHQILNFPRIGFPYRLLQSHRHRLCPHRLSRLHHPIPHLLSEPLPIPSRVRVLLGKMPLDQVPLLFLEFPCPYRTSLRQEETRGTCKE